MCILFLKTFKSFNSASGAFKLILAANRDEHYTRPSKIAHVWKGNKNILGGRDVETAGTWLAMTDKGKIGKINAKISQFFKKNLKFSYLWCDVKLGILLNIMDVDQSKDKDADKLQGRGLLINDFLNSDKTGFDYGKTLLREVGDLENKYNPFNLVTVDLVEKNRELIPIITTLSNVDEENPQPVNIEITDENNIFGFGNSPMNYPFKKVVKGKEAFEKLIREKSKDIKNKDDLIRGILNILKSTERYVTSRLEIIDRISFLYRHLPDKILEKFAVKEYVKPYIKHVSSIMVKIPEALYGTRTHTIILIDENYQVDFNEWTMKEPIDIFKPIWTRTKFTFPLKCPYQQN